MKAILLRNFGSVEQLELTQLPKPEIQENEVLVKVNAISINPVDAKTRAGKGMAGRLRDKLPIVLGWDISGVVQEVGSSVTDYNVGDEVFGMLNFPGLGGAYAEYVAAPADQLALKPKSVSHEEAAATTLAALTAYSALIHHAKIQPGQKVLIHAAAGGVGHFAVQIAKHLGAHVIGTSSAENKDFVLSLGADEHIDYKAVRFEDAVKDADLVLDAVGSDDNILRSITVTKKGGTVISIPSGMKDELGEAAKAQGVNAYFFLVQSNGEDMKHLAAWLEQGVIKPHVSKTYALEEMAEAHLQQESGKTRGKLIILP